MMMFHQVPTIAGRRTINTEISSSLIYELLDNFVDIMFDSNNHAIKDSLLRLRRFAALSVPPTCMEHGEEPAKNALANLFSWLHQHEEAQVMVASVLMVVGVWWLVRTLLSVLFNLICPVVMVLLAVICVPQLRQPLLGQNYPAIVNLIRNILINLAESLKT